MTEEPALRDYEGTHHEGFIAITRGWLDHFSPLLTLNERRLYDALASFYNGKQMRSFPKKDQLESCFCAFGSELCKARASLARLGLIEWWYGPYLLNGKKHWGDFYRLPYADKRSRHMGSKQQTCAYDLLKLRREHPEQLPEDLAWVRERKTKLHTDAVTDEQVAAEVGDRLERYTKKRKEAANAA
jgi:hypothetical protein